MLVLSTKTIWRQYSSCTRLDYIEIRPTTNPKLYYLNNGLVLKLFIINAAKKMIHSKYLRFLWNERRDWQCHRHCTVYISIVSVLGYEPADLTVHPPPPPPKRSRVGSFFSHRCLVPPKFFPQRKSGFCRRYSH